MKSGEPRNANTNQSAGFLIQAGRALRMSASAVARKKPAASASTPKWTFQIIPEPISVNCWQSVKSERGRSRSPMPIERSA